MVDIQWVFSKWTTLSADPLQKPSTAVEYLAAHLSKIHGLDWHPDSEHILATSSQDNSVKVSGTPVGKLGICVEEAALSSEGKLQDVSIMHVFQGFMCILGGAEQVNLAK